MNENLTRQSVYADFRRAQSEANSRPYRLPKDWQKHLNKMSEKNRESLTAVTNRFNTRWKEVDPFMYFICGFELLASFSYHTFLNPKIIKLYVQKDKNIKRREQLNKETIAESAKWVKGFIKENNIPSLGVYCMSRTSGISLPVKHYLENNIDLFFLTWLVKDRLVRLEDNEIPMVPYVMEKYRENVINLEKIQLFLDKVRKLL